MDFSERTDTILNWNEEKYTFIYTLESSSLHQLMDGKLVRHVSV